MDILISSNLERLLAFSAGAAKTVEYMAKLKSEGAYTVGREVLNAIDKDFKGYFATEENTSETIKETLDETNNLIDTHTAVGLFAANKYIAETSDTTTVTVVASTASPFKFASDVYSSITGEIPSDGLAALDLLTEKTGVDIPYPLKGIAERKVRFTETINSDEMPEKVLDFAN